MPTTLIEAAILAYLLGSIPFGLILTQLAGAGDLRSIGSGNIGATNVLRTGRKGLAAATLILDGGKGCVAVLAARALWGDPTAPLSPPAIAAVCAIIGHCFPIWLKFRGGKGVATMLGVAFGVWWLVGLITALLWLAAARLTKVSSLGGMSAAIAAPIVALALHRPQMAPALAIIAAIVVIQHRANIARLRAGTEPKIGAK